MPKYFFFKKKRFTRYFTEKNVSLLNFNMHSTSIYISDINIICKMLTVTIIDII